MSPTATDSHLDPLAPPPLIRQAQRPVLPRASAAVPLPAARARPPGQELLH